MKPLQKLAEDGLRNVESGYYEVDERMLGTATLEYSQRRGLVQGIKNAKKAAIICEVKYASPSAGEISTKYDKVSEFAKQMQRGGAVALSVLTEPKNFNGSLLNLVRAREATSLPIIMKDIIVSEEQIRAAVSIGASAVLLIEEIFTGRMTKDDLTLAEALKFGKQLGLEVIVETHTHEGLRSVMDSECDIIGINNRDLKTFDTKIETTFNLLKDITQDTGNSKIVMSESGFERPEDIAKLVHALSSIHRLVPNAFLIGTSIMKSDNIESKVRGFVEALNAD